MKISLDCNFGAFIRLSQSTEENEEGLYVIHANLILFVFSGSVRTDLKGIRRLTTKIWNFDEANFTLKLHDCFFMKNICN